MIYVSVNVLRYGMGLVLRWNESVYSDCYKVLDMGLTLIIFNSVWQTAISGSSFCHANFSTPYNYCSSTSLLLANVNIANVGNHLRQ